MMRMSAGPAARRIHQFGVRIRSSKLRSTNPNIPPIFSGMGMLEEGLEVPGK
jgi:hypothetical protein